MDALYVPFAYEGVVRELVARAKYRNRHAALVWLALPCYGIGPNTTTMATTATFIGVMLLVNSRLGRDAEVAGFHCDVLERVNVMPVFCTS